MPENRFYYSQFGRKPAQLSAVVPGLGQLYNKQYLKAASAISIFTFACGLTLFLAARATIGAWFTLPLLAVAPLILGAFHLRCLSGRHRTAATGCPAVQSGNLHRCPWLRH